MEIDTELFSIASDCAADDILELPIETMKRLNVINNGIKPARWTIESIERALYLKGERDTLYGIQKFLLVLPSQGRMYIHFIFDGGKNADKSCQWTVTGCQSTTKLIPLHEVGVSGE